MAHQFEQLNKGSEEFPIGIFTQTSYLPTPHYHIEYELLYISEGNVYFEIEDSLIKLSAGDVIFLQPGTSHCVKKSLTTEQYRYYAILFAESAIGPAQDSIRKFFIGIRVSRFLKLSDELLDKIKNCENFTTNQNNGYTFILKSLLYEIISYAIITKQYVEVQHQNKMTKEFSVSAIEYAVEFIHKHYNENISFSDILGTTSYSKSHFIRIFKKYAGSNVTDYVNKYRIEKACLDLIYTTDNITEIATKNGFNNVQYFSKIFKQYMSCTPKQYQKKSQSIVISQSSKA